MIQQTIQSLKEMRLFGFAHALREQLETPAYAELPFEQRLALLVDQEALRRSNSRIARYIKNAQLKQQCAVEDIDISASRGIDRAQVLELAACTWIQHKQNVIITGPTGAGKSYLACALAHAACRHSLSAKYVKMNQLVRSVLIAKADGSYPKLCTSLDKVKLLVIDEWLRDPLADSHARELLDILDDRFRSTSTIFVSQLPVAEWHAQIQNPTLADAILDRIVHDAHRIELKGESMRKKTAQIAKDT